jgi:SAM-dependent methyltransferase
MNSGNEREKTKPWDAVDWIKGNVEMRESNPVEFLYDRMESQSGGRLPVIYLPFDGTKRGHFADRGQILDFAAVVGARRILDFGPGDGWPSLLLAPLVKEVLGVDASARRVEVCRRNAETLEIGNARFIHVPAGQPLPFEEDSFDGAVAASSIEQTPDPRAALKDLHRVLKPGGRLRVGYESLSAYRGGREREIMLGWEDTKPNWLVVFDRDIEEETVRHYGLSLDLSLPEIRGLFAREESKPSYAGLTPAILEAMCKHLVEGVTWTTRHPSCRTYLRWMNEIGFRFAKPTHDGGTFAEKLFDRLRESQHPKMLEGVDELLRPVVDVAVCLEAPSVAPAGEWEPMITAVK